MQVTDWAAVGIEKPHQRLFVLQWHEIFSEASLDTWQVRTSNVLTILGEIEDVTRVARTDHGPAQASLPSLLQEALASVTRDITVKEAFPFVSDALLDLKKELSGTSHDTVDSARLENIARRCRVLREQMGRTYRSETVRRLRSLLEGEGKAKEDQLYLTMSLATDLAASGYSLQHLRSVGVELKAGQQPFLERFDQLVSQCANDTESFRVLFVVREWEPGVQPTRKGAWIELRDTAKKRVDPSPRADDFFSKATPNDHIVSVNASALDPFAARATAESLLTNDFAAIAFSSFRDPKLSANGDALVVSESGFAMLTPADGTRRGSLARPGDWKERTDVLLRMEDVLEPDDVHHLSATLQYFRLAVTHPSDEVRLVNLWVAAETLVRRAGAGSILSRVTSALAPLLDRQTA